MSRRNNRKHLKNRRKQLRNNLTPAEASLWKLLKGKELEGLKFRRQHSFGPYVLDFYSPQARLSIELDGAYHFNAVGDVSDSQRDKYLDDHGIEVLRFENKIVFEQSGLVLEYILERAQGRV